MLGWSSYGVGLVLLVAWSGGAQALCSTGCSGHGSCGSDDKCACFDGYWGADCSFRHCPNGTAWVGRGSSQDDFGISAHTTQAECSRAGVCQLSSGTCQCFTGFTGSSCERTLCNRDCNGRGVCMTMRQLGEFEGLDADVGVTGDGVGPKYGEGLSTVWDGETTRTCSCDWGFSSADCSEILCPAGDNPFTTRQQQRAVTLTVDINGGTVANDGSQLMDIRIAGHKSSTPFDVGELAAGSSTASDCSTFFASLDNIDSVTCLYAVSGDVHTFTVSIAWEMDKSTFSNLFVHNGNPALEMFTCDLSDVDDASVTCAFADVDTQTLTYTDNGETEEITVEITDATTVPNKFKYRVGASSAFVEDNDCTTSAFALTGSAATIAFPITVGYTDAARWTIASDGTITAPGYREYTYCSGVGTCDRGSGTCTCHSTTTGASCEQLQEESGDSSAASISTLLAEQADYSGAVLRLETQRAASTDFNFLVAVEGGNSPLFSLGGSGLITGKSLKLLSGATVQSGGLVLSATGETIQAGPLVLDSGDLRMFSGRATISSASGVIATDVATITATSTSFAANVLSLASEYTTTSSAYKLLDLYYDASGTPTRIFEVIGDGTVRASIGPLEVSAGGASITEGLTVTSGGSTITQDDASTTGVLIEATSLSYVDDVLVVQSDTTAGTGFGLFTLNTGFAGSTTVLRVRGDGQLRVYQGGVQVDSGGLIVSGGGLTVSTSGLVVDAGGANVDALTVTTGPTQVTDGGLTVLDGGATITTTAAGTERALVIEATSTGMDNTDRVVEIRSSSPDTGGQSLLWAGAENGGSIVERFNVEADGDVTIHGDLTVDSTKEITGAIGTTTRSEGRFSPLLYSAGLGLLPSVQLAGEWTLMTRDDCGHIYVAGSTNAERSTGTYNGVVIQLPPSELGTDTASCIVTVIVRASDHPVFIRPPDDSSELHGHMLSHSGGTVSRTSISTTSFGSSIGTDQLERSAGGDDYDRIVLMADPLTGTNMWYILDGFGDWQITSQGVW